jgi:hypothetical protein
MTAGTLKRTQAQYSEPDHTPVPNGSDHLQASNGTAPRSGGSGEHHQMGVLEGQWVPPPPLPEGTYNFVISDSTGPKGRDPSRTTFIGLRVTVADGPHADRSSEQKVFRDVTNYGEVQRLVSATDLARAIEGPDAPERTFAQAAEVIQQARKQRLPFAGRVTWGAMDYAAYDQLAGSRGNTRGRAMVWGAARFDQVDEHGQPAARGIDGQLLRPREFITRFVPRRKGDTPSADAVASGRSG